MNNNHFVLWIDDNPSEEFIDLAYNRGIEIASRTNYDEGIEYLKDNLLTIDAIILDVNCTKSDKSYESPSAKTFRDYLPEIRDLCKSRDAFIPWFVYTAGDYAGVESLSYMIPETNRDWDDRQYYNKPADRKPLFDNLIKAIRNRHITKIKHNYRELFSVCPDEFYENLLSLLLKVDNNYSTDSSTFNDMRKLLEDVVKYIRTHGIDWEGADSLNDAKKMITIISTKSRSKLIPGNISWAYASCNDVVNNGSHTSNGFELYVDKVVKCGNAPYLIRSTLYELLNILYWAFTRLPKEEDAIAELQAKTNKIIFQD